MLWCYLWKELYKEKSFIRRRSYTEKVSHRGKLRIKKSCAQRNAIHREGLKQKEFIRRSLAPAPAQPVTFPPTHFIWNSSAQKSVTLLQCNLHKRRSSTQRRVTHGKELGTERSYACKGVRYQKQNYQPANQARQQKQLIYQATRSTRKDYPSGGKKSRSRQRPVIS